MSRTVLFSEVDEVEGRFPDYVVEIREVFAHAQLPDAADERLAAIADRIASDTNFREDLASMLATVCALEPQISHLEVLGILAVAAVGAEQARVLAQKPGVDPSARQVFNFVLETRRRQRDVVEEGEPEGLASVSDEEGPVASEAVVELQEVGRAEPVAAEPVIAEPAVKPLVTASAPGGSSMLARALALAADDEVQQLPATAEVPARPLPVEPVREVDPPLDRAVRSERVPPRAEVPRVVRMPEPVVAEPEQDEVPPRRWGMWTAAACGVLLGFGLGVFAHFDHRSVPAVTPAAVGPVGQGTAAQATVGSVPPATKHMTLAEELRADLALLGPRTRPERAAAAHTGGRETQRASVASSARARETRAVTSSAELQRPTLVVRSSGPASGTAVAAQPSTRGVASSSAPAPLVASARPVNLAGAAAPGNVVARSPEVLPRVITGSAGVMAANLISSPAPAYPMAASAAGVQGEVIVEAVVGRDGGVVDTRVVSGPMLLRAAALDAVQRWHYRPYEVDGKAIEVATTARLEFRLDH